eukprot:3221713-Pleurochrysis_carterae.AAC.1
MEESGGQRCCRRSVARLVADAAALALIRVTARRVWAGRVDLDTCAKALNLHGAGVARLVVCVALIVERLCHQMSMHMSWPKNLSDVIRQCGKSVPSHDKLMRIDYLMSKARIGWTPQPRSALHHTHTRTCIAAFIAVCSAFTAPPVKLLKCFPSTLH